MSGECGYIDKTGREVIAPKYDDAISFQDGLAPVKLNRRWGYIDKTGKRFDRTEFKNFDRVGERHPEFVPRGTNFCGPMGGFVKIFDSRSVKIDVYAW